ncbi:MAG: RPA family protein [Halobacteria archaeon]
MSSERVQREVAKRVFAGEFNDAYYTYKTSDDERAPTYLLLPTGERANRVFLVGTLTEKEEIGSDSEYWRARVVDPTGTFFIYAGQYQPEAMEKVRDIQPPEYVAVVGKPSTYETDEGDVMVSVRPESINVVDEDTRDRWIAETAERTIERIKEGLPEDLEGVDEEPALLYDEPTRYRDVVTTALENLG